MFATRRFVSAAPRAFGAARSFQSSARFNVKVGDAIPNIELVESSPGNKVNIAKELQGKGIIVGVPAAFSTSPMVPVAPGFPSPPPRPWARCLRFSSFRTCRLTKESSDQAPPAPAPTCLVT